MTFIRNINAYISGYSTVRAVDDEELTDRSLRALEADIKQVGADFVVIDPFYYLQFEKNTSRTTGGDASNTSMKLRAMTRSEERRVAKECRRKGARGDTREGRT